MKGKYNNKIYGYAIMPNHVHCLIYISDKSKPLPTLIFNAKRFLAYGIIKLLEEDEKKRQNPLLGDSDGGLEEENVKIPFLQEILAEPE